MPSYYISSMKYNIQERLTRQGKVFDVVFRIVTLDGVERQKRLCGFESKTHAKNAYVDFVTEHCTLVKNNPIKQSNHPADGCIVPTLGYLIPRYLESMKNQNKESTIYDRRNILYKIILPYFGNAFISDLTAEKLYAWQDTLWNSKNPITGAFYAHNRLSSIRATLSAFLNWSEWRYGTPNNLRRVRKPKRRVQRTVMKFWSRAEFDKFISVVDDVRFRAIFCMLYFTGRRKGEVIALNADDVGEDFIVFDKTYSRKTTDGAAYRITTTKNEKRAKTAICEPLRAALAEYVPQTPFFFGGDKPIHENTISHAFERYIERSGVTRIRLHDLRHSFVSLCIHLGATVYVVADLIGDTVEQVLKTYGHLYEEDKLKVIGAIT